MFKKIILVTLFCLSSLIQVEFQQSWQQDLRDAAEFTILGKKTKDLFDEILKSELEKTQNDQIALENANKIISEKQAEMKLIIFHDGIFFKVTIEDLIKFLHEQRGQISLKKDIKNFYLLSVIKYIQKKYNLSDDVLFKKESNCIAYYDAASRVISLDEKFILKKEGTLGCLVFLLVHEFGHLRQHEKMGMLNFLKESKFNLKNLETDADRFAMSHLCKECRKMIKDDLIKHLYPAYKEDITNDESEEIDSEVLAELGFKSLKEFLKHCDESQQAGTLINKFENLEAEKKIKRKEAKLDSFDRMRPFNNYLSKEEFLKELNSVETEECLCCKLIAQENLHTVPAEL